MENVQLVNYLRVHRRRTGLTQEQLAFLLGGCSGPKVARYERNLRVPSLESLIGYEVIFNADLRELFPGESRSIRNEILKHATNLRKKLMNIQNQSAGTRMSIAFLNGLLGVNAPDQQSSQDAECGTTQFISQSFFKTGRPAWAGSDRLLAIDPTSRGFGFAVLEQDPTRLLEWGVAQCRDYLKSECLTRIGKLIAYFQPTDLLIENPCPTPRSRCHKLRTFIRRIKVAAKLHRLTVHVIPSRTVRMVFSSEGARNQEQRAAIIGRTFPELAHRVPPHREIWMSEDYRMPVFDSLALIYAYLIGTAAINRADLPESQRRDFFLYLDEFQNFTTLTMANMLSELRKYGLSITMAHQYLAQLEEDVREAVLGNVGTVISFRVGLHDAKTIKDQFFPKFDEHDLLNLPNFQIYIRMMIDGEPAKPFSAETLPPLDHSSTATALWRSSQETFGRIVARFAGWMRW